MYSWNYGVFGILQEQAIIAGLNTVFSVSFSLQFYGKSCCLRNNLQCVLMVALWYDCGTVGVVVVVYRRGTNTVHPSI
jgi:trehalose utilization protein